MSEKSVAGSDKDLIRADTLPLLVLIDAGNIVQRAMEKRLSKLELSVSQQRLLALLYLAKESLTPSMLAALLLQEVHSVSGLLNRLEDRDLITRIHDKQDRRVVWVGLSGQGRNVAEKALDVSLDIVKEMEPVLGQPKNKDAIEVLREVRNVAMKVVGTPDAVRREALRRVWG